MNNRKLKKDGLLLDRFEFILVCPHDNNKNNARIVISLKGSRAMTTHNVFKQKKWKGSLFDVRRRALQENQTPKDWIREYSGKILKVIRKELQEKEVSESDFINDTYDKNTKPLIFEDVKL